MSVAHNFAGIADNLPLRRWRDTTETQLHLQDTVVLFGKLDKATMMLSVAKTLALVRRNEEKERRAEAKRIKDLRKWHRTGCKPQQKKRTPRCDRLFELPPELRLLIYAEVFRQNFIAARPQRPKRGTRRGYILGVIQILHTSSLIRREALDVFTVCLKDEIHACQEFARTPRKHDHGGPCGSRCYIHVQEHINSLWHVSYLQELEQTVKNGEVFCEVATQS